MLLQRSTSMNFPRGNFLPALANSVHISISARPKQWAAWRISWKTTLSSMADFQANFQAKARTHSVQGLGAKVIHGPQGVHGPQGIQATDVVFRKVSSKEEAEWARDWTAPKGGGYMGYPLTWVIHCIGARFSQKVRT